VNPYERRARRLIGTLQGTSQPFDLACALVFVHALSSTHTPAGPPPGMDWDQLTADPDAAQIMLALSLVQERENGLLDGMVEDLPALARLDAGTLAAAMGAVEALAAVSESMTHRWDAFGALYLMTSGLSAQQARGEFYTPAGVAQMLAQMQGPPRTGQWVIDPACGTGALLLSAIDHARQTLGEPLASSITFIGVELSHRSSMLARMNLALAAAGHQAHVLRGDSLAQAVCSHDPAGDLREVVFDQSLANPPFGKAPVSHRRGEPLLIPDRLLNRRVAVRRREAA
jgi:hypothetical protein